MADLLLRDFPDSLLERIDAYIRVLEELNPGQTWSRTSCVSSLLARSLAEIEGSQLRWNRRKGPERRQSDRGTDRRNGDRDRRLNGERRKPPYPDMVDLVIDHILKNYEGVRPETSEDETWKERP